jgi:DNA-binding NarL/FixJ family response regulator
MSNPTGPEESPKVRVLLVDSHQAFLRAATNFFQRHHYLALVGTASGGEEALTQAQDLRPQVILIDVDDMLDPSGLEAISRLRTLLPDVGIIVMTALDIEAYRREALEAGADDCVFKFNLADEVLPAVRRVHQASVLGQVG